MRVEDVPQDASLDRLTVPVQDVRVGDVVILSSKHITIDTIKDLPRGKSSAWWLEGTDSGGNRHRDVMRNGTLVDVSIIEADRG